MVAIRFLDTCHIRARAEVGSPHRDREVDCDHFAATLACDEAADADNWPDRDQCNDDQENPARVRFDEANLVGDRNTAPLSAATDLLGD